jgi:hypothetical protein
MITETLKLDHAEYVELCNMFKSSDKKNGVTAIEVIKNLDVNENIAYMMLLFINYGDTRDNDWVIIKDKIFGYLHSIDAIVFTCIYDGIICMDTVYYVTKHYSPEVLSSVKEIIADWLKDNFENLGWDFVSDFKLKPENGNN